MEGNVKPDIVSQVLIRTISGTIQPVNFAIYWDMDIYFSTFNPTSSTAISYTFTVTVYLKYIWIVYPLIMWL